MTKKKNREGPSLPTARQNNPSANLRQLSISRSAPLPHPAELEGYEKILPGAADRIFAMVEKQAIHRQGLENKAIAAESRNSLLGIIAGLSIGVAGLGIAGFLYLCRSRCRRGDARGNYACFSCLDICLWNSPTPPRKGT